MTDVKAVEAPIPNGKETCDNDGSEFAVEFIEFTELLPVEAALLFVTALLAPTASMEFGGVFTSEEKDKQTIKMISRSVI